MSVKNSANRNISPSGSPQTIYQGNPPLSLLLSPPQTSPLILLDTMDSSPPAGPPQQYSPAYPRGPRVTGTSGSYPVYDPSRGEQLRNAADRANPYRDRVERVDHTRGQYRARSRSPRRSIQPAGAHESREAPRIPFMGFNQYPREMYIPPGMNNLMHHNPPSSSPALSPNNNQRGHASGDLGESPGHTYPPNDGNMYGNPHDQQQQVQGCDPGPGRQPANKKQDTNNNDEDHLCEFAAPCRMHPSPDGMHYRKVVSHVFGRNKAVTKLFPLGVWVHYCRKHYQRARYRADQWPFTQCDLLLESLNRMENWDGVESFELILRRREQMRVGRESEGAPNTEFSNQNNTTPSAGQTEDQDNKSSGTVTRPPGRKHPTAIIAPVPDWLRQHVGHGKTFQEIRHIIELVRNHMVRLRNQERAQQQLNHIPKSPNAPGSPRRGGISNGRKGRITKPAHRDPLRVRASTVRFPDVEILPHFKPWVKEAALRQRSATNGPMNEADIKEYEAEQRISGGGHIIGEIQDTRDTNARAESSQSTNGDFATNDMTPRLDGHSESLSTVDMTGANLSQMQPHIGRAGTNRGQSESQRRRSERVYIKALDRVPNKKPGKDGEPEMDGDK
ncbi:unnamed protein product [Penicillium nalgiovense]|uniref:Uncharacterized protein n=1 Tax=Penicillium nalgiovense TaxID=60175 RepID=A0A9W4I353_PENNA|nr:unnamed protein product [Penicillium nalgiovense]CAG7959225.1 unnamed protein product [Penicillium nalgiovense]CAG7973915.1 unnamed protein product [Penicillium nalgiovense]CAG8041867.1 unnamed protein product [Penicillium nalgiovense]CAG8060826.1 unnamed protein product [Penicillium nalgiovense]